MSSYLPSFRRTSCVPVEDAPMNELPVSESTPLASFEADILNEMFASNSTALHEDDPWLQLDPTNRRAMTLRFLRFHCLKQKDALAHMRKVASWRKEERPWERSAKTMLGPAAGLPLLQINAMGKDGEILLYSPAKFYAKQEVDHPTQEIAIKTFFEQLLYAEEGTRGRSTVAILDFQDMRMSNVDLVATKNGIRIFTDYYPDTFRKVLIINYAKWLYGTWKCVAPLLDARTVRKVVFLTDAHAMREELAKSFIPSDIPRWLGGEGEDGVLQVYTGPQINPDEVARSMQAKET